MSKKFCLVYYYVPEDKDDPEVPNAFGVNIAQEDIKLNDIRNMFPLEGEYIFRFKYKSSLGIVWMDISEDSKIPLFNGKIYVKASRITWEGKSKGSNSAYDEVKTTSKVEQQPTRQEQKVQQQQNQQQQQQQQQQQTFSAADFNLLGTVTSSNDNKSSSSNNNKGGFDDFDLLAGPTVKKATNNTAQNHDDLLGGFDQPSYSGSNTYTKSNNSGNSNNNMAYKDLF